MPTTPKTGWTSFLGWQAAHLDEHCHRYRHPEPRRAEQVRRRLHAAALARHAARHSHRHAVHVRHHVLRAAPAAAAAADAARARARPRGARRAAVAAGAGAAQRARRVVRLPQRRRLEQRWRRCHGGHTRAAADHVEL